MDIIAFGNKWLHLLSIIGMVGSLAFMRFVVMPAFASAGGIDASDSGKDLRRRYGIAIAIFWGVVLVTGFLNFALVSPNVSKTYHMIVGMKIMLALIMFGLTTLLSHPIPALSRIQEHTGALLTTLILLGVLLVGISAHLNMSRINGTGLEKKTPPAATQPAPTPPG